MTRRFSFVLSFVLAACGRTRPLEEVLPKASGEAWTLRSAIPVPEGGVPELVRGLGLRRAVRGTYQGGGDVTVTVYEMGSQTSAFELLQKWRADGSSMYFHRDCYFVVVESTALDYAALRAFAERLERNIL